MDVTLLGGIYDSGPSGHVCLRAPPRRRSGRAKRTSNEKEEESQKRKRYPETGQGGEKVEVMIKSWKERATSKRQLLKHGPICPDCVHKTLNITQIYTDRVQLEHVIAQSR